MLFNSITFLVFLPLVFAIYWLPMFRKATWQNLLLIVASYVFYGWLDWRFCGLLAFSSATAYFCGMLIGEHKRKGWMWVCVMVELGVLCFFKYFAFFTDSITVAFRSLGLELDIPTVRIILPVGISFYSFMAISYVVDVYHGKFEPVREPMRFFAYSSFFPQLLAGPIGRASELVPQFSVPRSFDYELAVDGCRQMLWGYFKKLVIADGCSVLTVRLFGSPEVFPGSVLLMGAFIYAIQIYADFSGYSDLAIGCGKLFGIRLMDNFKFPYFATNIADFWRRWHISLTTWFRDYVYIPLGGNRCSKLKQIRNTFIVFLLSGLWHGANWTFVIWGFIHACFFMPLLLLKKPIKESDARRGLFATLCAWTLTFASVMLAWIFFRADSFSAALHYLAKMFSPSIFTVPRQYLSMLPWIAVCMLFEWFQRKRAHALDIVAWPFPLRWALYFTIAVICIAYKQRVAEFIYFQF